MSLVLKERVVEVNRPYERNAKAGGTRVVGVVWESLPGRTEYGRRCCDPGCAIWSVYATPRYPRYPLKI